MTPLDRMKEGLRRFILQRFVELGTDFHALYRCTIISQKGDGTLELRPDKVGVAAPTGVKFRGLPGVQVKFQPGARVLLGFEDGDPRRPYATAAEDTKLMEIVVTASVKVTVSAPQVVLGDGLRTPVCVGDTVNVGLVAGPYPVTGSINILTSVPASKVKI